MVSKSTLYAKLLDLKDAWLSYRNKELCIPTPIFITIDDCGFKNVYPGNSNTPIVKFETYKCLSKLSKKFNTQIALAFTTKYLDKDNITGYGQPLPYLDRLMNLLSRNKQGLEIANHGWVHNQKGNVGEFYLVDENRPVSKSVQEESFRQSKMIYEYWGLKFPKSFIPPHNAFVPGVTDKILSKYGCRYIVSTPYLHDDKYCKIRLDYVSNAHKIDKSILFLPRTWLGVVAIQTNLVDSDLISVKRELYPNLGFSFKRPEQLNHSFMTHIGNFLPKNYSFWKKIFEFVEKKPYLYLPENIEASVSQWLLLKYGSVKIKKTDGNIRLLIDKERILPHYLKYLNYITIKLSEDINSVHLNGDKLNWEKKGDYTYIHVPITSINMNTRIILK